MCFRSGLINPYVKPEYLLTVNVAQEISRTFTDVTIKLEEATEKLKKESADIGDLFSFLKYLKSIVIRRKGRIDIVLYERNGLAICPIEIKGFGSPALNKKLLYDDIDRIINYLSDTSGRSSIKFGAVAFIQELKVALKSEIPTALPDIENEYQNLLNIEYMDKLEDIAFEVHGKTAFDNLFNSDEEIEFYCDNDDDPDSVSMSEVIDVKGLYAGIIVNVVKKGISE